MKKKSKCEKIETMKNIKLLILFVVVTTVLSCNNQQSSETVDLAVPVSVENIKLKSIQQYIGTTGTAKSKYETELYSEIAADYQLLVNPRTRKEFKLGDKIQKGDVIIEQHAKLWRLRRRRWEHMEAHLTRASSTSLSSSNISKHCM